MRIQDVVRNLFVVNSELTVYCTSKNDRWTPESVCYLLGENEANAIVAKHNGQELYYFLEIEIIMEVIEGWRNVYCNAPNNEELVEVVIYYAQNDAWPLSRV